MIRQQKRGADMGNKTLEQKNTNKIGDYFLA